jgi:low temperature requirement protein LtrA
MTSERATLMRAGSADESDPHRVTNIELFFDLVYVFAVTQLSHYLLDHPTPAGAFQAALLLGLVWQAWIYTTWLTNWLDPGRDSVRLMLVALMLLSLLMSAALPKAFESRGLLVAAAYAAIQVGRSVFAVVALRGEALFRNYLRLLFWCIASSALVVGGGGVHGHAREALWLAALGVDLLGGAIGFYTPGVGRSDTHDWTIDGSHFAERCQGFVIIALGESIVVIGTTLSGLRLTGWTIGAFAAAFVGAVSLWWVYFDRSAEAGAQMIAASDDPGRLGRSAYHYTHPLMVAGVIVTAAADDRVLAHPSLVAGTVTAWMALGGTALFLAGHVIFKLEVWRAVPWSRVLAVVALLLLVLLADHVDALWLGGFGCLVVIAVIVNDRLRPVSAIQPAGLDVSADG